MKSIAAGEFKAKCLDIMDRVSESGEPVVVTKHGKAIVKLVPAENAGDDIFGYMAGKVKVIGDILSPAFPLEEWDAE
jgi:prevent-host-death family protein